MKLILLGPPGSGKGTLAKMIAKDFDIPQISTGDILRENIKNQTQIGKQVEVIMKNGELVGDDIMINLIKNSIKKSDCKNGFILDGFPRTLVQGKSLEEFAKIDGIIKIDLNFKIIEERITGRRMCVSCGELYNTSYYKKSTCEKCGSPLCQRDDDKLETVRNRLEVYDKQTTPLINFYGNKVYKIKGLKKDKPEDLYSKIYTYLKSLEENCE